MKSQRESNFCSEIISSKYATTRCPQRANQKIERHFALSVDANQALPAQVARPGFSFLQLAASHRRRNRPPIMLISHKENWLSRGGTKTRLFMLQSGDGGDELTLVIGKGHARSLHKCHFNRNLALLLAKLPQISPRESKIHGLETTADFLAGRFDARIVNAVRGLSSVGRAPQWH